MRDGGRGFPLTGGGFCTIFGHGIPARGCLKGMSNLLVSFAVAVL